MSSRPSLTDAADATLTATDPAPAGSTCPTSAADAHQSCASDPCSPGSSSRPGPASPWSTRTARWRCGSTSASTGRSPARTRRAPPCWRPSRPGPAPRAPDRPAARDRPRTAARHPRPGQLPAGFAVRYEPATRPLEVGGDWYDTVALPDGRIGIVVGDCVGHGLAAPRPSWGSCAVPAAPCCSRTPVPPALMALDRFAAAVPGALCTTVFCGVLDPESGQLTYSSAGHPPGILAHSDGTTGSCRRWSLSPLAVSAGHRTARGGVHRARPCHPDALHRRARRTPTQATDRGHRPGR